ncbi:hypothetical protein Pcinc_018024 [Petrolisthes cinctipes]|uniref:Uncharacterized protein n=1 Tax=Petrolisthes cinctipes TaxID=88211 RepID=A0AAE1KM29_PETCI|nr:hypothetical protein Pcinc_018024 [Petrolisthes cinctipes]
MERWNGVVLDINATCLQLGTKCLQLLAMHAISGCDTVSYPFNKGKIRTLNVLKAGDIPGLFEVMDCCKGHSLSCTIYCVCAAAEECCNPFTPRNDADVDLEEHDEDTDSE